jgi:dihydrofolate reductase
MAKLNLIVAASSNNVIGRGNDIPWHLPTDLKNFKKITDGGCVLMGRKCWESIPAKYRPLPNRTNWVFTRDKGYIAKGACVFNDFNNFIMYLAFISDETTLGKPLFIIGGSEIYKAAFPIVDKVYLTRIHAEIEGDVYLEGFNPDEWVLDKASLIMEENGLKFRFEEYSRKV